MTTPDLSAALLAEWRDTAADLSKFCECFAGVACTEDCYAVRDLTSAASRTIAALEAVLVLHRPLRIYDECGHQHADADVEAGIAIYIEEIGYSCDDGFAYEICRECCGDGGIYQREECASDHHRPCWPCPTSAAITAALHPTDTTDGGSDDR